MGFLARDLVDLKCVGHRTPPPPPTPPPVDASGVHDSLAKPCPSRALGPSSLLTDAQTHINPRTRTGGRTRPHAAHRTPHNLAVPLGHHYLRGGYPPRDPTTHSQNGGITPGRRARPAPGVCLKGRALWGQTQGGYKAVGARCKIGWGAVTGCWNRVGVALGLRTCLRVELKEEPWGGGGTPPPFKQSPARHSAIRTSAGGSQPANVWWCGRMPGGANTLFRVLNKNRASWGLGLGVGGGAGYP